MSNAFLFIGQKFPLTEHVQSGVENAYKTVSERLAYWVRNQLWGTSGVSSCI